MAQETDQVHRYPTGLAVGIALLHLMVFIAFFGYSWGYGVSQSTPPAWLQLMVLILGFPLIPLIQSGIRTGFIWWGADRIFYLLLIFNSVLWGIGCGWIVRFFRGRAFWSRNVDR